MMKNSTDEMEELQLEGYRRMTPEQKLRRVGDLNGFLKDVALAEIRGRYPNSQEREILLRYASRTVSRDLMLAAFNWDPEVKGY